MRSRILVLMLMMLVAQGCTGKVSEPKEPVVEQSAGPTVEVAVCVTSTVPGDDISRVAAMVKERMLNKVARNPAWTAYLGTAAKKVRVDAGCPGTPFLLQPGATRSATPEPIPQPTGYRSYIVVLPEADIARLFPGTARRTVPQEITCQSRNCGEAATALYLSPTELSDAAFLERGLLRVLGVVPPGHE